MKDSTIIEMYFQRNEESIKETQTKYGAFLYNIAYKILCNRNDSEESVNDTYLDAWNSIPPHRPEKLSAFLAKITRRRSIDKLRKRTAEKRDENITDIFSELSECVSNQSIENETDTILLAEVLNSFISQLGNTERRVFLRRYWYSETIKEVSNHFGFTESKTKSILFRVRNKLRLRLEREGLL